MTGDESRIEHSPGGVSFVGREAVDIFRAMTIKSGLTMYGRSGMKPNRAWTVTRMLKAASEITGESYKRTRPECLRAADDLGTMIQAARAVIREGEA